MAPTHSKEEGDEEEVEEGGFVDGEQHVHEVMAWVISGEAEIGIEERQVDIHVDERASVTALLEATCGRRKGNGSRPYFTQFTSDHVLSV